MRDLKNFTSHVPFLKKLVKDVLLQNRGNIQEKNDNREKEKRQRSLGHKKSTG